MKKVTIISFLFSLLVSCSESYDIKDLDIEGNWSAISKDIEEDYYHYQEVYFFNDTLEVFSKDWALEVPGTYKIIGDSIFIQRTEEFNAKIKVINPDYIIFESDYPDLKLTRIGDDRWTIDSLIVPVIYYRGFSDSLRREIEYDFIQHHFTIRELEAYIFHGYESRRSMLKRWKSYLDDTTYNSDNEYLQYLIDYFDE
jgi:hypothetical protein